MTEEKDKPQTAKDECYVNSKEFTEQLRIYYDNDNMTDELAINLRKIAEGLSYNWRFINYTTSWKEEMIGDAFVKMYAALQGKKFDLDRGFNPFSYFNRIAWNAFTNRIKKENKQHDGLQEYKQMVYEQAMCDSDGCIYVKPDDEHDSDFYDN